MGKIKDVAVTLTDLKLSYIRAVDNYNKAAGYAKNNYRPGSQLYTETMQQLDDEMKALKKKAAAEVRGKIRAAFDAERGRIRAAVSALPTEKDLKIIEMLKDSKLTQGEKEILSGSISGAYFARKALAAASGEDFTPVDITLKKLDNAEAQAMKAADYILEDPEAPTAAALIKGTALDDLEAAVNAFTVVYKA